MYSSKLTYCFQSILLTIIFVPLLTQAFNCRKSATVNCSNREKSVILNDLLPTFPFDWKNVFFEVGEILFERIELLGSITEDPNPSVLNRPFLSRANRRAAALIRDWLVQAGCSNVSMDWVGNVAGWYKGNERPGKTLILGSHYDTVKNAGKYDGTYGILVAIGVMEALFKLQVHLPFDIQIVAFENEEGNNDFGLVHTGSTLYMTGSMARRNGARRKCYRELKSQLQAKSAIYPEISLVDHIIENAPSSGEGNKIDWNTLTSYFCHHYPLAVDNAVLGYWEWHIEQGPILDQSRKSLGIVSAICGQERWSFDVKGKGGHAGTVPVFERQDAVAACVEMIQKVEEITKTSILANNGTTHLVATVGNISVAPGISNVIPHFCSFTLDIRSASDRVVIFVRNQIIQKLKEIAKRRKVKLNYRRWHHTNTVELNSNRFRQAIEWGAFVSSRFELQTSWTKWFQRKFWVTAGVDNTVPMLVSGAGHDAVVLHQLYDVNMVFIRCREGISHHPSEFASKEDMLAGAIALFFSLLELANMTRNR